MFRFSLLALALFSFSACRNHDVDGDGYDLDVDCNDADAAVHPDAVEVCDFVDNDCNGEVDERDGDESNTWYADTDGDGFGDPNLLGHGCVQPPGLVPNADDCDDQNTAVHPGASETDCFDTTDYNCDGSVGFTDADGDGAPACTDCDDTEPTVGPDAAEVPYDGVDNDCDATTRDDDIDGDGFLAADDCDDSSVFVNPDAVEVPYDGLDNDCDGTTPDDDLDGDGFVAASDCDDSDAAISPDANEIPHDGVDNDCADGDSKDGDGDGVDASFAGGTDCDDGNPDIAPGLTEIPYNGVDEDCDAATPDDDLDGDGVDAAQDCDDADPARSPLLTEVPYNAVDDDCDVATPDDDLDGDTYAKADDCDDRDPRVHPSATEIPHNGVDDDCAGGDSLDGDGDGYEAVADGGTDCDDTSAAVNPGATEIPHNGVDDDCAGGDSKDGDGDGYDAVADGGTDCDDTSAAVNPGATEVAYDGVDNDCDSATRDDDLDADGVIAAQDCDDNDPARSPLLTEVAYDGVDNDCDTATRDDDLDGDGYAKADDCNDALASVNPGALEVPHNGIDDDCVGGDSKDGDGDGFDAVADGGTDCDDRDPAINPGATEVVYDGVDNDCDATTLDDDLDGDGVNKVLDCDDTDPARSPLVAEVVYNGVDDDCDTTTLDDDLDQDGYVGVDDCNDRNAAIHPGATEVVYNGVNDDCDATTLDDDLDQDGFPKALDCDDADANVSPAAHEVVYNGLDDDCDATTLDDDLDQDGDTVAAGDCDDQDPSRGPSQTEVWYDGVDTDCDGADDFDQDGDGFASWYNGQAGADCNDLDPLVGLCDGSDSTAAAPTCLAVQAADPSRASGTFWLDPAGNTTGPFQAWCDLSTDGGGYTMLKALPGVTMAAPAAEAWCADRGMQLMIPRSPAHLQALYANAMDGSVGPSASADYLRILGIYPLWNGATCQRMPLTSANPRCDWAASDGGPFFVHWRWDVSEPNGDNRTDGSQYYSWVVNGSTGRVTNGWHNDITGGYNSAAFMCDLADKQGPSLSLAPASCLDILRADPTAPSGAYTINPDPDFTGPIDTWCDMDTDGGGWTLIGHGREGWIWDDWGQGDLAGLADPTSNTVVTMPAWTVQALMGGGWLAPTALKDGLRLDREEAGQTAKWEFQTLSLFDWSFPDGYAIRYTMPNVGARTGNTRDISITGDDYTRIFTWAYTGHSNVMGFSGGYVNTTDTDGDGIPDVQDGWMFGSERYAMPRTTLWVRE